MMKIKFLVTREVEAQGEVVQRFEKGRIYELESRSAERWLRRQLAMEVTGGEHAGTSEAPAPEAPAAEQEAPEVTADDSKSSKPAGRRRVVKARASAAAKAGASVLDADTKAPSK